MSHIARPWTVSVLCGESKDREGGIATRRFVSGAVSVLCGESKDREGNDTFMDSKPKVGFSTLWRVER